MGLIGRDMSDPEVIAASVTDRGVFEVIFERYYQPIFGYLAKRVGPSSAEDLASEVFAVAFKQRSRFRPDATSAAPWLYGIAANLARRHYRSQSRRFRAFSRAGPEPPIHFDPELEGRVDAQKRATELTRVLSDLRRQDREVLMLYALADLSYEEISEALSIPVGTVRSRLSRTRSKLRNLIPPDGQQGNAVGDEPKGGA